MREEIKLRDNFDDVDTAATAYLEYDFVDGLPDFSAYALGSEQSIVLRNVETGGLERIDFQIVGDSGPLFPRSRRLWGVIHVRDGQPHCCLCFYFDQNKVDVESIAASFCAPPVRSCR